MSRAKQASKGKRGSKAVPVLGAAGLSVSVTLASAFAGGPLLVDGKGHPLAFVTNSELQREWNAYVKVHGIKRGGVIYTPYSAKFHRGGIHCGDTGSNISPGCDVEDTTIYGGP